MQHFDSMPCGKMNFELLLLCHITQMVEGKRLCVITVQVMSQTETSVNV